MENKQRQIAYKVRISRILKGEYVREEGWLPNYIIIEENRVSRINIMGVVIAKTDNKENGEILVDDKTGKISVRAFNNPLIFNNIKIGDFVLLIGRPREYNNEKYVVPEIIKKIQKSWFELRLIELNKLKNQTLIQTGKIKDEKQIKEELILDQIIKSKINSEDILGLIKRWDKGGGADYEKLVEKLGDEKIIKTLLEEGEIFEITPGKLKAL